MASASSARSHPALNFKVVAKCSTSKARTATMELPHAVVDTPVFMPVGTQVRLLLFFTFKF